MTARVLVVDDLAPNVKLLEAKLSHEYYDVLTAADGNAALDLVRTSAPDIVLLDVMMPGLDGFEVCRRIKGDPALAHIPVVMVTALSDVADRVRGLEAGADDFLTKPVNDIALFARVKSLLRLKMAMDELRLREDTQGQLGELSPADQGSVENLTGARVLLVEDNAISADRMTQAFAESGYDVTLCTTARDALTHSRHGDIDLIVINLNLADDDALRLCSQLRSQEATRQTPLLLVIGEADTERLAKALDLGVNDYIVRPIDRLELRARARTQIRRRRYQDRLRTTYRRSLSLALTDSLTGLYNRRYLDAHLTGQLDRVARTGKPLSVLLIDIDRFKEVNDNHGHDVGDQVLREVSRRVAAHVRSFDTVARLGGEEFVVVMPDADAAAAMTVAERLRGTLADTPVPITGAAVGHIPVTVSIGAAVTDEVDRDPAEAAVKLLRRADRALYAAKAAGRDHVCLAEDDRGEGLRRAGSSN
ncbi:MAG TPA: PleD family two-component system response regulator [Alphaproteobacteria bacterium]